MFWEHPLSLDLFNEVGLVKADSNENFATHSKFTTYGAGKYLCG